MELWVLFEEVAAKVRSPNVSVTLHQLQCRFQVRRRVSLLRLQRRYSQIREDMDL